MFTELKETMSKKKKKLKESMRMMAYQYKISIKR